MITLLGGGSQFHNVFSTWTRQDGGGGYCPIKIVKKNKNHNLYFFMKIGFRMVGNLANKMLRENM